MDFHGFEQTWKPLEQNNHGSNGLTVHTFSHSFKSCAMQNVMDSTPKNP